VARRSATFHFKPFLTRAPQQRARTGVSAAPSSPLDALDTAFGHHPNSQPSTRPSRAASSVFTPQAAQTGDPMHDRFPKRNGPTHKGQVFTPPGWLSVDELEDLLMAAIDANRDDKTGSLTVIDEYFAGDETFEGSEYKRALLRLLGLLWPNLADLLGGTPVEQ
jgi:hypothetical protein